MKIPTYMTNWRRIPDAFDRNNMTLVVGGEEQPRGRDSASPDRYEVFIEVGGFGRAIDLARVAGKIAELPVTEQKLADLEDLLDMIVRDVPYDKVRSQALEILRWRGDNVDH